MAECGYVREDYAVLFPQGPSVVESYLKKLKRTRTRFFSKYTKRYFVLDLVQGSFYYTQGLHYARVRRLHSIAVRGT